MVILLGMLAGSQLPVAAAQAGQGETYSEVFTDEMAEEIAAWVLEAYPELPFKEPQIAIHEDGIVCSGVIEIWGMDVEASGQVSVFVEGGKLNGKIEEIEVAGMRVPGLLLNAIDDVRSLYDGAEWEIEVTKVELREGELLVEGEYK